ncbi:MAG TPA: hypothetical protein VNM40_01730 [Candidatus Paceibacterota bacterium]|nr:hypothetical protein [Candidatus Paceibacterota bacterium]
MSEMGMGKMEKMGAESEFTIDESELMEPESEKVETGVTRRTVLGGLAAAGAAALGGIGGEAAARDSDSREYIEKTKRLIQDWYRSAQKQVYEQVISMQTEKDRTGKTPEAFRKDIPLVRGAENTFSKAWLQITYEGDDSGGRPTYKVQFYVTEKNKDVDCGWKILTLTPRR